jgi:hypothetical protein
LLVERCADAVHVPDGLQAVRNLKLDDSPDVCIDDTVPTAGSSCRRKAQQDGMFAQTPKCLQ